MKEGDMMYYAFVPKTRNLMQRFTGWTNNAFIYRTYSNMMNEFYVDNLFEGLEFKSDKECLSMLAGLWEELTGKDISTIFFMRNKLFAKESQSVEGDVVVANDDIYESFLEKFGSDFRHFHKLFEQWYQLYHDGGLDIMSMMSTNNPSKILIDKCVDSMRRLIYESISLVTMDNHCEEFGKISGWVRSFDIWEWLDQAHYLKIFIETEVKRFFLPVKF